MRRNFAVLAAFTAVVLLAGPICAMPNKREDRSSGNPMSIKEVDSPPYEVMVAGYNGPDPGRVFFTPEEEEALARAELGRPVAWSWGGFLMSLVFVAVGLVALFISFAYMIRLAKKVRRENFLRHLPADGVVIDPEPRPVDPAYGWGPAPGGIDPRLARRLVERGIPLPTPIPRPSRPFLAKAPLTVIDGGKLGGAHRKPRG